MSDRYGGLTLNPQVGLVPLREDPESGLWEFWLPMTGERPHPHPSTDRWQITGSTGMVFVLVPGGTWLLGAQSDDPSAPLYYDQARGDEAPIEATLSPFLVSKYEMTRGQWLTSFGQLPVINSGLQLDPVGRLPLPMCSIPWTHAKQAMLELSLELPTEAQWEAAARAETTDPWWTGPRAQDIQSKNGGHIGRHLRQPVAVGSYEPNPWGLYDTMGNVWELCRDRYHFARLPLEPGDGYVRIDKPGHEGRVNRGGAKEDGPHICRAAMRALVNPGQAASHIGLRPVRRVVDRVTHREWTADDSIR